MAVLQALVSFCLLQASPAHGTVTVTASALVVQGRQAKARRKAIAKALRRAVMAQAQSHPGLAPARNRLLAEFRNYVRSYRVIEERFVGNGRAGHYRVTLDVRIDNPALSRLAQRLRGTRDVPSPCIQLTTNPTSLDETVGAQALLHLAAAGFESTCRGKHRKIPVRLDCSLVAQGKIETRQGATVRCSLTSPRASASVNGSALAQSPREARTKATLAAATKASGILARRLEEALACRRLRRIIIQGPVGPTGRLQVAHNILRSLSPKTKTVLRADSNRLVLTLVTHRCNTALLQTVNAAPIPPGLRITARTKAGDVFLHVTAEDTEAQATSARGVPSTPQTP